MITAICSNHVPMDQSYSVSTEVVCPSRKTTLCSSPCTIKSTSDKLPSKAFKTIKQPRKNCHINICSLRNKIHEVNNLLGTDDIPILPMSETHLDNTFDTEVAIHNILVTMAYLLPYLTLFAHTVYRLYFLILCY